jgi:deoxycytidylate deaminase
MAKIPLAISHPELIIGIAGAIGVDIDAISDEISRALSDVGYETIPIRVTKVMMEYPATNVVQNGDDFFNAMMFKMDYANRLCEEFGDPATLMRMAIQAICHFRVQKTEPKLSQNITGIEIIERHSEVLPKTAFLIRQLKRPDEVELLRRVYGKQFILVSGYGSADHRKTQIERKLKDSLPIATPEHTVSNFADQLMERDADEGADNHGQHLRDTFHLADVFVDGINRDRLRAGMERFVQAFFGRADIGPSKIEYGMYAAKSASLRSSDLSRQVGAAVFSPEGELITQGCNEVPKAFGGTYWDGEEPDHRDVKLGFDPNDQLKKEVIRDLFERIERAGLVRDSVSGIQSEELVDALLGRSEKHRDEGFYGCLKRSSINDLTEYGRVVHAEMSALCDAARLGKPIKNAILFCTTFPCHNCTKHILTSGIARVIFMEPYPKSKAKTLHSNEIELERASQTRVSFLPFLGISPFRYRDIFQKGSRKKAGKAVVWYHGEAAPMIEVAGPGYLDIELLEIGLLGGDFNFPSDQH